MLAGVADPLLLHRLGGLEREIAVEVLNRVNELRTRQQQDLADRIVNGLIRALAPLLARG